MDQPAAPVSELKPVQNARLLLAAPRAPDACAAGTPASSCPDLRNSPYWGMCLLALGLLPVHCIPRIPGRFDPRATYSAVKQFSSEHTKYAALDSWLRFPGCLVTMKKLKTCLC